MHGETVRRSFDDLERVTRREGAGLEDAEVEAAAATAPVEVGEFVVLEDPGHRATGQPGLADLEQSFAHTPALADQGCRFENSREREVLSEGTGFRIEAIEPIAPVTPVLARVGEERFMNAAVEFAVCLLVAWEARGGGGLGRGEWPLAKGGVELSAERFGASGVHGQDSWFAQRFIPVELSDCTGGRGPRPGPPVRPARSGILPSPIPAPSVCSRAGFTAAKRR